MISSFGEIKNWVIHKSHCLPARPLNWLSILLVSCFSVPKIISHPSSRTPSPSLISVPLQAIFVAIVIAHFCPASATIWASCSWCFAFKTLCLIFTWESLLLRYSDFSTETVPTKIGCPVLLSCDIISIT